MNYQVLLEKLYSMGVTTGIKLDIENCRRLNVLSGEPDRSYKTIHVAGTNGKGSVCTKLASCLQDLGYKTGLFTSPHISCFRERICVNGVMISEEDVSRLGNALLELSEKTGIPTTFFEVTTLMAFLYFKEQQVDWAVLETGLGGRLDATNIVMPEICAVTSISFDHTHILGSTLEEIAREKAGIIKPDVPVVVGYNTPQDYFKKIADEKGSPFYAITEKGDTVHHENSLIAEKMLEVLNMPLERCKSGLEVNPKCRFELHKDGYVILDVAHNPDGLEKLFLRAKALPGRKNLRIVFGLSRLKEIEECLKVIQKHGKAIHVVSGKNERCLPSDELAKKIPFSKAHATVQEGILEAVALAEKNDERLVVCGSFYIMNEAREALGLVDPSDTRCTNFDFFHP